jgi:CRP-like cAMP-binding protein
MDLARLDAVPLLAELPVADRAAIATIAHEARVAAGDVLVRDGDFRYEIFAIEDGEADLFRGGELVAHLTPGDVVGEIGALERHVANATVVACGPLRLITLSELDLRLLRRSKPAAVARMQGRMLRQRSRLRG